MDHGVPLPPPEAGHGLKFSPAVRWLCRSPIVLYKLNLGWLFGTRFVLLTHTGRRTGLVRYAVLEVIQHEPASNRVVVMSATGRRADWYHNLRAHPPLMITLGRHSFRPSHAELPEDDAVAVFADYEERRCRRTKSIEWALVTHMVGWRYDGSDESRRRLVRQLPMLAFWPADSSPC